MRTSFPSEIRFQESEHFHFLPKYLKLIDQFQKLNSVRVGIKLGLFFSPYNPESFSCEGQDYGYYADVESGCEVAS